LSCNIYHFTEIYWCVEIGTNSGHEHAQSNSITSVYLHTFILFTAPEAPDNLNVTELSSHAMNISWQIPNITNGKLKKFEVNVTLLTSQLRKKGGEKKNYLKDFEVNETKYYSYKVSETWNLYFLQGVINILCGLVCLLFCTWIYIGIVILLQWMPLRTFEFKYSPIVLLHLLQLMLCWKALSVNLFKLLTMDTHISRYFD